MIATLLIWIYAGTLFYLYGAAGLGLLRRWLGGEHTQPVGLPLTIVFGMALVTALATGLSLFIPLGPASAMILLAVGILLAAAAGVRPAWRLRWPQGAEWWAVLIMGLTLTVCLESGTRPPSNPDTNSYHAQTIRWIESYAAVPGLGNLYGRLAYNSSWLLLNAAFSLAFLQLRSFHVMGGLIFLVAMLHFAGGLPGLLRGEHTIANWMKIAFIPAAFWILPGELSSPGTDLPAILLTWVLLSSLIEFESSTADDPLHTLTLATVPAVMTVFKLSSAPIALVSFYLVARSFARGQRHLAWVTLSVLALVVVPWMARSVVLSGYLVYPYPQVDLFQLDWKVPATDAVGVRNGILGWARLPDRNWADALQLPASAWIPEWLRQRTGNQLLMLGMALVAPFAVMPRSNRRFALPVLSAYAGMLVWFIGAPNWRFGYGVVLGLAAFAAAALWAMVGQAFVGGARRGAARGAVALLSAYLVVAVAMSVDGAKVRERILLPADYYPSRATACDVDGLQIYCAEVNLQCSYFAFPCVPGVSQTTHARGAALSGGFYAAEPATGMP
ncbi:MAG TPA: hypothetical protein VIU38_06965 [Anaerolineales bacterium]